MRLVAWNIRAGAGTRLDRVCRALAAWQPDIAVLSEFRATPPSQALAQWLAARGLEHQHTTASPRAAAKNALLVASRYPLRRVRGPQVADPERLLCVRVDLAARPDRPAVNTVARSKSSTERRDISEHDLSEHPARATSIRLCAVHVPNRVTGRKYGFLDALVRHAKRARPCEPTIVVGDTNSGCRVIDEESSAFNLREERWFEDLAGAGLHDAFRVRHGERRAYTWYSPNGRNGFRLDQLFCNAPALEGLAAIDYRWAGRGRHAGVSDHAAILADLNVDPQNIGQT